MTPIRTSAEMARYAALAAILMLVAACSNGDAPTQASASADGDARTNAAPEEEAPPRAEAGEEVFYHVFFRSFSDSDGDRIGDLKGMAERLDYLKDLGVTSILLTPLQPSPFYHNYFATDFESIEPAYGTMDDYTAFIRAAHARGLKVYLDMEIQYVGEGHPWWTQSQGKPGAPFADFLIWRDDAHAEAEPFLHLPKWEGYDGRMILDTLCAAVSDLLVSGGSLLLVQSEFAVPRQTLAALAACGLDAQVVGYQWIPFGPVLTSRAQWLEDTGRLQSGRREEELVVIRADKP